jgi:N-acetylglucosaminyldiphosphoundecaprenol N-acetyl-beta-D-mannosaminyltransferase
MSEALMLISTAISGKKYLHVVSLNPENIMAAQSNAEFRHVLSAETQIIDGIGVHLASRWTGEYQRGWDRVTGIDLMDQLIRQYGEKGISLRICLLGGRGGVSDQLARTYRTRYPSLSIDAFDEADPTDPLLATHIAGLAPNVLFVAFGSPTQELWIDTHKDLFPHTVCMGVGGAFDMLSGRASRAPRLLRSLGLEWLCRLITQPWRWRRQISLIKFLYKIARSNVVAYQK